jgi:hypothetical protein
MNCVLTFLPAKILQTALATKNDELKMWVNN